MLLLVMLTVAAGVMVVVTRGDGTEGSGGGDDVGSGGHELFF